MTKVDKTRNYYGDLELSSNATLDDIKKQYRKLGTAIVPFPARKYQLAYQPS